MSPTSTDALSVLDDLEGVAERARRLATAEMETNESLDHNQRDPSPGAQIGRAAREARADVLRAGADGLERLASDPSAELSDPEGFGVEAIVLLEGRPALLVQDGDFPTTLPPQWSLLDGQREAIKDSIARVGRIEVSGHPDLDWVGTGFLVAEDLIMTNRHVAIEFAKSEAGGWSFIGGRGAAFDLLEEAGNTAQLAFTVTDVVGIHPSDTIDLALLRVEAAGGADSDPLPAPLSLTALEPDELVGRPVYVVGYPAWDGRRNEPEPMRRIFMDLYNVKRLQPGVTTAATPPGMALGHDCSTLGGNSGSPVFDLSTHQVMGLHFGGRYGFGNFAVPLWRLVDDPMVAAARINFTDTL